MNTDDLLRRLAEPGPGPGAGAKLREDFLRACRQADSSRAEQQRIDDIADLLDAEESRYEQALAAVRRGDRDTAVTLLRQCAEAGTGEAAWLLAQLLDDAGNTMEAAAWNQRASDDGDPRADEKPAAPGSPTQGDDSPGPQRGSAVAASPHAPAELDVSRLICLSAGMPAVLGRVADAARRTLDPGLLETGGSDSVLLWDLGTGQDAPVLASGGADHAIRLWYPRAGDPDVIPVAFTHGGRAVLVTRNDSSGRAVLVTRNDSTRELSVFAVSGMRGAGKTHLAAEAARRWLLRQGQSSAGRPRLAFLESQAGLWRPARELVVSAMMLPPSEVPGCGPDTPVAEAMERIMQSGARALPVIEMSQVVGIVTLADLARAVSGRLGRPALDTVRGLIRPAAVVPPDTPLSAVAQAITDDGIIVVSGPEGRPAGYLTAESVLSQTLPGASTGQASEANPPPWAPGGAVLLSPKPT